MYNVYAMQWIEKVIQETKTNADHTRTSRQSYTYAWSSVDAYRELSTKGEQGAFLRIFYRSSFT